MTTPFLWGLGTSNSGLLTSLLTLQSTELNSLTTSSVIVSSVGGSSGKFTNADTGGAIWAEVFATLGAIGSALTVGANIAGWFLQSPDSGTTYESATLVPPRPADFVIPLPATTIGAGSFYKCGWLVRVPALQFKVLTQNNTAQTFAASANTVKLAPISVQM